MPDDLLHLGDDIIKFGGLSLGTVPATFLTILDLLDLGAYHIFSIAEKSCPVEKYLVFVDKSAFSAKSLAFVD